MILTEEEILKIINKEPKKLKNKFTGKIIYEYHYELHEQLELIRAFIHDKTGKDVGEILPPKGEYCGSFVNLCIRYGVNPIQAMQNGNDIMGIDFAMNVALRHFKNKYNESD